MRRFTALSAGLLVSVLGSTFTAFALGVWVFQETGSAAQYGLTLVLNFLPGILAAPLAGALVDRWNRRAILIACNVLNTAAILSLAVLYLGGVLQPWHIFVSIGVQSVLRSLFVPAMNSVVVLLAPKQHVGRANGMVLLAEALGGTLGFALGGVLVVTVGLDGVLLIDCATYVFNLVVLLFVRIPQPPRTDAGAEQAGSLLSEIREGWRYLAVRRGLVALVLFYSALNLYVGYVDVLLTPLVLSFASALSLGLVLAFAGLGMVLGGLAMTIWGGPRRRIHGLAGFGVPLGLFLCLGALRPSVPLIMIAALGFTFCSTVIDGTTRSVLQLEVEPDMQGRTFATFGMVTNTVLVMSYALAGPVADNYFEPLLRDGGVLAGSVGRLIGVGDGRGMALLVLLLGLLVLVTAVVAYLAPSLRNLPDRPSRGEPTAEGAEAGGTEPEPAALPAPVADGAAVAVPSAGRQG